ncbi:YidH family protein [Demequina subtropica]|uniref:YidH family protein n=1 Tax=Demequina subtropica TaxID=1638989 RepID=UPI0007849FD2|nr:DUF202 domain-containing protein [Demequina subtropica]
MPHDERDKAAEAQAALSNERTFLSWIRTALALIVTGVALVAFDLPVDLGWRLGAGAILLLLAIANAAQALYSWRANDRALRHGEEIPDLRSGAWIAWGVVTSVMLLLVGWVMS